MKKKRLDRDIWTTITVRKYKQKNVENEDFKGVVGLLMIDEVSAPSIWNLNGRETIVCDSGMKWLQLMPVSDNYVITAMINTQNAVNAFYIDIIGGYGFDADGVAYFSDLYLDLIVAPDGFIKVDDMDELDNALSESVIKEEAYSMALLLKKELQSGLLADIASLNSLCLKYLNYMEHCPDPECHIMTNY